MPPSHAVGIISNLGYTYCIMCASGRGLLIDRYILEGSNPHCYDRCESCKLPLTKGCDNCSESQTCEDVSNKPKECARWQCK